MSSSDDDTHSSDHSSSVYLTSLDNQMQSSRERSNSVGSSSGGWIVLGSNTNTEEKSNYEQARKLSKV